MSRKSSTGFFMSQRPSRGFPCLENIGDPLLKTNSFLCIEQLGMRDLERDFCVYRIPTDCLLYIEELHTIFCLEKLQRVFYGWKPT